MSSTGHSKRHRSTVGVISYSDPALQVITAGHGIRHKSSLPVKAYIQSGMS